MSSDYYFAAVYADWSGFNVSILEVNNFDKPDKIRLLESETVDYFSHQAIIDTILSLTEKTGKLLTVNSTQPSAANLHSNFIGVIKNKNPDLDKDLRNFCPRWRISSYESKDIDRSLCNLVNKFSVGLEVSPHLKQAIEKDTRCRSIDLISHRLRALILLCDRWGDYMRVGLPTYQPQPPRGIVVG
jgi:hypothetical protein